MCRVRALIGVVFFVLLFSSAGIWAENAYDGEINDVAWRLLKSKAENKQKELIDEIRRSKSRGINTEYAEVSKTVVDLFIRYSEFDYRNPNIIKDKIDAQWWKARIPNRNTYHIELPFEQLQDSIDVADNALKELRAQNLGKIALKEAPDFGTLGAVKIKSGLFEIDGNPVFPSGFNWMPHEEETIHAFGRLGGVYYPLASVMQGGGVWHGEAYYDNQDLRDQSAKSMSPKVFFLGYNAADWQKNQEPEAFATGRQFVPFDIDNPGIRSWFAELFKHYIPATKNEAGVGARLHLLANEPHFATRKNGWMSDNGVSTATKEHYKSWLQKKYSNINNVNSAYGTHYANFAQARDGLAVPVDSNLQGGPVWYDWCRFNMDRVTDWFRFLKENIQKHDPNVPVTIKLLGWIMGSEWRDHGIDIEALAGLQDVLGSDLGVNPHDAIDSRGRSEEWVKHYSIDWVQQSMVLDFYKSIAPGKPFYDSEWHGLSTDYHHQNMTPEYIRAAMWLAHTNGMNMIRTWVWGRKENGDASQVNSVFYSEPTTQPWMLDTYGRTMKELNAHAKTVVNLAKTSRKFRVFYSEDSAIQDRSYIKNLQTVYEALKLANFDVGFTTPKDIVNLSHGEVLVIPPTPYQSDWALQRLRNYSGKKILINPSDSFHKNEHGKRRSSANINSFAQFDLISATGMAKKLRSLVGYLDKPDSISYRITNKQGQEAFGVFVDNYYDHAKDETTVFMVNVGLEERTVALSVPAGASVKKLITGEEVQPVQTLAPYQMLVLKTDVSAPSITPTPISTPVPTVPPIIGGDECDTTAQCKALFGYQATDCKNSRSKQSVCMCGKSVCAIKTTPVPTSLPSALPSAAPTPDRDQCDYTSQCKAIFGPKATDCKNSRTNNSVCMCGKTPC